MTMEFHDRCIFVFYYWLDSRNKLENLYDPQSFFLFAA
ncbi:hypothetical protein CSB90_1718 [Pseudomonas aeruginosa]|nr:hypothetical protein CSB90_1718 [Pseudomonas aeruginosa]